MSKDKLKRNTDTANTKNNIGLEFYETGISLVIVKYLKKIECIK